jgi:predicted DNA-binding transcriptional regulator AlpA
MTTDFTPLLTRPQIAKYLGLSAGHLAHAAIRGEGPPFIRVGPRAIRYDIAAVRNWLHEQSCRAA